MFLSKSTSVQSQNACNTVQRLLIVKPAWLNAANHCARLCCVHCVSSALLILRPIHGPARPPPAREQISYARHSPNRARKRAAHWLCSWLTRDSLTPSTSPISLRFNSSS